MSEMSRALGDFTVAGELLNEGVRALLSEQDPILEVKYVSLS